MPGVERIYSREEICLLGPEAIERYVKPVLRPEDDGKYIAIDVLSGEFELDKSDYAAVMRLRSRVRSEDIWLGRAGYPTTYILRSPR